MAETCDPTNEQVRDALDKLHQATAPVLTVSAAPDAAVNPDNLKAILDAILTALPMILALFKKTA